MTQTKDHKKYLKLAKIQTDYLRNQEELDLNRRDDKSKVSEADLREYLSRNVLKTHFMTGNLSESEREIYEAFCTCAPLTTIRRYVSSYDRRGHLTDKERKEIIEKARRL